MSAVIVRVSVMVLCTLLFPSAAVAKKPEIGSDRVIFVGGKIVRYEPSWERPGGARDALGNDVVSRTVRPLVLVTLKRVVFVQEERLTEGSTMQLSVYDFAGNLLGSSEKVAVEVDGLFFLEKQKRIFLGQSSRHVVVATSLVYDENGRLVRRIPQPSDIASFGHTDDQRIVWIIAQAWANGARIGQLKAIDSDGNDVYELRFDRAQTVPVKYKGRTYSVHVDVPHIP